MDKLETVKLMLGADAPGDELLLVILEQAAEIVKARRWPFGAPADAEVPARYEYTQCQIAVELFGKMGAEGQTEHNENGVNRKWEAADVSPSLLRRIIPLCGSVSEDA